MTVERTTSEWHEGGMRLAETLLGRIPELIDRLVTLLPADVLVS